MKPKLDLAQLSAPSFILDDDALLDRCDDAYQQERSRWAFRRRLGVGDFELVRRLNGRTFEVIVLPKCKLPQEAERWLAVHSRRAAMRAALETLK